MKKENSYNQFTKSDIPLDVSLNLPVTTVKSENSKKSKPKINAIVGKKTDRSKTATSKTSSKSTVDSKVRTKLKKDDVKEKELEKLNEENLRTYRSRSRRNQVIIIMLSVLLALSFAFIAITFVASQRINNCMVYTHGVDSTIYINGVQTDGFVAPAETVGNRIMAFDVNIKINSSGNFNIKYEIKCYQGEDLIKNILPYNPDPGFKFKYNKNGYYEGVDTFGGNQNILICRGVIIDQDYANTLSASNIKLEIHITVTNA